MSMPDSSNRRLSETRSPFYIHVNPRDEEEEQRTTSSHGFSPTVEQQVKRQFDASTCNFWMLIIIMLAIIVELTIVIRYQEQSLHLNDAMLDLCTQKSSYTRDVSTSNNIWQRITSMTAPTFALHVDETSKHIYAQIPNEWITNRQPLLLIDQIKEGIGLQKLFWDPGNILSQHLCYFSFSNDNNTTVVLSIPNIKFRSKNVSFIQHSFSDAHVWTGKALHQDQFSLWVDMQEFFHMAPGILGERDLPSTITNEYGAAAIFSMDSSRSFAEVASLHSSSKNHTVAVDFYATYVFANHGNIPPADFTNILPTGHMVSTSIRRTIHKLDTRSSYYRTRRFHPKSGFNYVSFMNEDASIFENRQELYIVRHQVSQPTEKQSGILYLIDPLMPAKVRTAITQGVRWWDEACQAAGYPPHTFQAYVAPANFDAYDLFRGFNTLTELDRSYLSEGDLQILLSPTTVTEFSRVHFVQWIDRDIRSYSVGLRVIDPRSGEILRGHVRIEGLRLRQDALIAESLLSPYSLDGSFLHGASQEKDVENMILQRVKHLGAHEVGHSLGLAHNFAGSSFGKVAAYASVMDYPPPLVSMDPNNASQLVLNDHAYVEGIGAFDKVSIAYAYRQFESVDGENEWTQLQKLLIDAEKSVGYVFVTDQDSSMAGPDFEDTKWDLSGNNAIDALENALHIRKIALRNIGIHALHNTSALSNLRAVLPIVYLWHRYEAEAVSKLIAGYSVQYPLRNDIFLNSQHVSSIPVNATLQWHAIDALINAILPSSLSLPLSNILPLTQAVAFGYIADIGGNSDLFQSRRGLAQEIDPLILYQAGVQLIVEMLLDSHRLERLAQQPFLFPPTSDDAITYPGIDDLFDTMYTKILPPSPYPDQSEICDFLASRLSNEYFVLLSVWKAGLESFLERSKNANNASPGIASTLTIAGVQRALQMWSQRLQQLEEYGRSWSCPFESIPVQQRKTWIFMLQSISSLKFPGTVKIPTGPPI